MMLETSLRLPTLDDDGEIITGPGLAPVPVKIHRDTSGMRVILGDDDEDGTLSPDVLIERHEGRWVLYVHRVGELAVVVEIHLDRIEISDESGEVIFVDNREAI